MKRSVPQIFFLLLVVFITTAFFGLIREFLMAVFWAIILAILFYKRFETIRSRMPTRPNSAAALTLVNVILLVIIPLTIITLAVINEAGEIVMKINANELSLEEQVADWQKKLPFDDNFLEKFGSSTQDIKKRVTDFLSQSMQLVAKQAISITQNIFSILLNFFVMLYVFFFFLRDGKQLVQHLIWVLPIGDAEELALLQRFESVARATVKGSLLVALVQGSIGGIVFWLLGIPAAFLWGTIMVLASLLPLGSSIIWFPWAIALFLWGDYTQAIILIAVGAGFIGVIDNFMRPYLVGHDTQMPDYLVLLSTLGGLTWFGLSGFVIGPIIAALFMTCWQMLGEEYGEHAEKN